MKTLTLNQIIALKPCWLYNREQTKKLYEIGARQKEWSALDVLALPNDEVNANDKLWLVLRKEFIEESILHEFACQCAESMLALIENPDPRSIAAIEAKRKWLKGEIDDDALAAAKNSAWYDARNTAYFAAEVAEAAAGKDAKAAAFATARNEQVVMLTQLLNTQESASRRDLQR